MDAGSWEALAMGELSMAGDRVSILDALQEWQLCELYNFAY